MLSAKSPTSDIIIRPAAGATVTLAGMDFNGCKHVDIRDMTFAGSWKSQNTATQFITMRNIVAKGAFFLNAGSDISMISEARSAPTKTCSLRSPHPTGGVPEGRILYSMVCTFTTSY